MNFAQTEDQLKLEADKLFYAGKYLDASPLYVRLLSLNPRSYEYNFRYGACLLYQSNRKLESLKYLRNAALNSAGLPPEFHYFFGRSLHLSYLFNEAIKEYKLYDQQRLKETPLFDIERSVQECENGKRLMTTITDIIVTDKKEISIDKFFRIYDLSNIGGSLLVTAEFQTKTDKKNNHVPLIHFPANPTVIYYSSYGERGENGKDIYVRRKLPDNSWGQPQALPGEVNTPFDEDFPYMHPDGDYLYFSSKGHNTMGGYDVFRAKYDKETNTFAKPENMDFAISSPDDDVFYVVDSLNKDAVFASSRQSQEGFLHVYKVKVDRVPMQMAVVKGQFFSSIDTTIKRIDFTIRDYSNGDFVGKFNSNEKGSYLITFPKGGKYEFVMSVNDMPDEFRSIVTIPFMKEFKPLKQQIQHINENGIVTVKLVNQFDQPVEDPASVLAEVVQKRGELNVNVQEFDMAKIESQKASNSVLKDLGMEKLNMIEVSYNLQDQIKKGLDNKTGADKLNSSINNLIVENSADFLRLEQQIKEKVAASGNASESDQKYKLLKEAQLLMEEQNDLKSYSANLSLLRDSINRVMSGSTSVRDIDKLKQLSSEFDKLVSQGDQEAALNLLSSNRILILGVLKDTTADLMGNLVDQAVRLDNQIVNLNGRVDAFNSDIKELDLQIQTLNNSLYSVKAKEAEEIKSKIASKEEEKMLIQEERDLVQKSIDKLRQEKFVITEQMELLKDAISNKSLVTVSEELSREAAKQMEKTNTNTLNSFVDQQVAEIEKKDPAIKSRVVIVNNLSAQNIYQEYKSSDQGIRDDSNLNAEDLLYKQLSNERKTLRMINKRLEDISILEKSMRLTLDQQAERQQLISYQNELTALIQQHELDIRKVVNSDVVAKNDQKSVNAAKSSSSQAEPAVKTYTAQEMITQVDPGYAARKDAVTKDTKLNELQKMESLNREDQRMLFAVNAQLTEVETKLSADPTDVTLKNQRYALLQAKTNTEQALDSRNTQIASIKQVQLAKNNSAKPVYYEPQSKITATTQTELVTQLDPEYTVRTEKINSNQGMTAEQKLTYLNAQDTKLIASVDSELKKVQSDLAVNPTDKISLEKQSILNDLKQSTQRSIDERNAAFTNQIAENKTETESRSTEIKRQGTETERETEPTAMALKVQVIETANETATGNQNGQQGGQNTGKQQVGDQIAENKTETERPSTELSIKGTEQSSDNKIAVRNQNDQQQDQQIGQNAADAIQQKDAQLVQNKTTTGQNDQHVGQNATEATKQKDAQLVQNKTNQGQNDQQVGQNATEATQQKDAQLAQNKMTTGQNDQQVGQNTTEATKQKDAELAQNRTTSGQNDQQVGQNAADETPQKDAELAQNRTTSGQNDQQVGQNAADATQQQAMLISKVSPTYKTDIEKIESNSVYSETEKLIRTQQLEEELIGSIDVRIAELNKEIARKPQDEKLKSEKSALQNLKAETEAGSDEREQLITSKVRSEMSDEQFAAQLITTLTKSDPGYTAQLAESRKAGIESVSQRKNELSIEESLSTKLLQQNEALKKQLEKQPTDKNLLQQKQVMAQLIKENGDRKTELKEDISILEKGQPLITVNNADLNEELNALDPEYSAKKQSIIASENDQETRNEKLLEQERDLALVLNARKELVVNELKSKPADKELIKEIKILEKLLSQNEQEIARLEGNTVAMPATLTAEQEKRLTDKLDTDYKGEVATINNRNDLSEEQKLDALQTVDEKLLSKVYDRMEQIDAAQEEANKPELTEERRQLTAFSKSIENRINERASTLDSKLAMNATTEFAKKSELNSIDAGYERRKVQLENDPGLTPENRKDAIKTEIEKIKEKVNLAIRDTEQLIDKDGNLSDRNKLITLRSILNDLDNELKTTSESIALKEETKERSINENNYKAENQSQTISISDERKKELLRGNVVLPDVQATYTTKSELETQDRQLEQYENYLNEAIIQQEEKVATSPEDAQTKSELNWLKSERENVQKKRRSVRISLGELEKQEVIAERSAERVVNSPELRTLDQREVHLSSKLEQTGLSKKERKQTEAELNSVKQEQQKVEGQLLTNELRKESSSGQDLAKLVANTSGQTEVTTLTNKIATLQKESDDEEIAQLNKKALETKDGQEKNYLLTEALKKQEASNDRLQEAAVESQLEVIQKESGAMSLETLQELEVKKRRYTIQIGELTKIIEELDAKMASTKPKAATALITQKQAKVEEQLAIKKQLTILEQKISAQQAVQTRPETISKAATEQNVSYQEEREIASSEAYKRYVEKAIPALELEKQFATLEAQLKDARSESRAITTNAVNDPSPENKLKVQQHAQQVAQLEKQLVASKQELLAKQQIANSELPSNGTEAMKWQNLLKRGVEPVQRAAIIAALVPMPVSGLEIDKTAVPAIMSKPIPVDVKSPTGLVYRVQVGAFSKPIPQDRFREFNPVSGETLENGITRYMAGYFNSSTNVTVARDKIRAIGYKDAFAIAYCDGKRISIAEARALEASGRCVPKGENELILEMATNTAVNLGITVSDSVLPPLPEVDYIMVPGGVKSEPVEKYPGLFYTVQVGVFNNPVNANVVNVMQPLMSKRLPNGQIRYSSGMYATIDEARPKKQEAIDKGIKDAFITAYYKSQRITLAEAEQLLSQNGPSILESNRVTEVKGNTEILKVNEKTSDKNSISTNLSSEVKIDPKLIITEVKVEERVQIVSKKTFDEFPREVLNRYNSHGSFYYDEQDKRVKSAIANSREELPQVYYFKDDIDTVLVMQPTVINGKTVHIDFAGSSIPGDFTDWLLRYNYRREFKSSEGTTTLRIFAVPEEQLDVLKGKLGEFGLSAIIEE